MGTGQAGLTEEPEQARAAGPAPWGQVGGPLALRVEEQVDWSEEELWTVRRMPG